MLIFMFQGKATTTNPASTAVDKLLGGGWVWGVWVGDPLLFPIY